MHDILRKNPVSILLWFVCTVAFVIGVVVPSTIWALVLLPPDPAASGEIWRIFTYFLLPPSFLHYAWISTALLWWGRSVEISLGHWRYFLICILPSVFVGALYVGMHSFGAQVRPLVGTHIIGTGVTIAALLIVLPRVSWRSWPPWVVGVLLVYYVTAVILAPLDILVVNTAAWCIAGGLFLLLRFKRRAA